MATTKRKSKAAVTSDVVTPTEATQTAIISDVQEYTAVKSHVCFIITRTIKLVKGEPVLLSSFEARILKDYIS